MTTIARTEAAASESTEIRISRRALKALADIPGLRCGPLSPLARLAAPPEAPDRDALRAALQGLGGAAAAAAPALLDPGLTLLVLLGDGQTSLVGQYVWPDAAGDGPGFRVAVDRDEVALSGPVALDHALLGLQDGLALGGVAEPAPVRMTLKAEQFWALTALLDAYQMASLRQRLARIGGRPHALATGDIVAAWRAGQFAPDPGWSVPLFGLLLPEQLPQDFEARLPTALAELESADLVARLEGDAGDQLGDIWLFGDELDLFCRSVTSGAVAFGLTVQRQRTPGRVDVTVLGGWRTPGGIWLAEVSEIDQDRVELLLTGPTFVSELLDNLLGGQAAAEAPVQDGEWRDFDLATPYGRDSLLTQLAAAPSPATTPPSAVAAPAISQRPDPASGRPAARFCSQCGTPGGPGARFCASCGSPLGNA